MQFKRAFKSYSFLSPKILKKQAGSAWNFPQVPILVCSRYLNPLFQNQQSLILLPFLSKKYQSHNRFNKITNESSVYQSSSSGLYNNTVVHSLTLLSTYYINLRDSRKLIWVTPMIFKWLLSNNHTSSYHQSPWLLIYTPKLTNFKDLPRLETSTTALVCIFSSIKNLKLVPAIFYQIFIFTPNDSPLKPMKNVFCFI